MSRTIFDSYHLDTGPLPTLADRADFVPLGEEWLIADLPEDSSGTVDVERAKSCSPWAIVVLKDRNARGSHIYISDRPISRRTPDINQLRASCSKIGADETFTMSCSSATFRCTTPIAAAGVPGRGSLVRKIIQVKRKPVRRVDAV